MKSGGTISILFTDILGSTDLATRVGDAKWDVIRRAHFTSLREELSQHSGTEVKNTGDGLMVSFQVGPTQLKGFDRPVDDHRRPPQPAIRRHPSARRARRLR